MPYLMIEDFSGGLDLRKSDVTAKPGTLRALKNGYVTAGGEIEKRKTLTLWGTVTGTHGLGFLGRELVVFGTGASAPGSLPAYVTYQQLVTAKAIDRIVDVQLFGTDLYTVARMTDGTYEHFFGSEKVAGGSGTNVRPHRTKMYSIDGQNLRISNVKDATAWDGTGSGIIDVSTEDNGTGDLVGLEAYYGMLALFGRNSIQVWDMDPDPALNTLQQVLGNIGLVAPNAVARYGNGDVLFLSHTGIRSLRARDSSNAAVLNDIGSPVDPVIAKLRTTLQPATIDRLAAIVDPVTGHFWLVWDKQAIVLSYYPNSKITAWATFEFPKIIDHITVAGTRIVARCGDEIFIYGTIPVMGSPFDPNAPLGVDPAEYDASQVEIVTPMLSVQQPATAKFWQGIDVACRGTWDIYVNPQLEQPGVWVKVATVNGPTFEANRIPIDMHSTHIQVRAVSVGTGPASLASIGIHYEGAEAS